MLKACLFVGVSCALHLDPSPSVIDPFLNVDAHAKVTVVPGRRRMVSLAKRNMSYQAFLDLYPVTTFDKPDGFTTFTKEGKGNNIPKRNVSRPYFFDKFDWVIKDSTGRTAEIEAKPGVTNPNTVWAEATGGNLRVLLKYVKEWPIDPVAAANRVLVLGGTDNWLSEFLEDVPENPYFHPYHDFTEVMLQSARAAAQSYNNMRNMPSRKAHAEQYAQALGRYFGRILFEGMDIDVPGIKTMPVGLTEWMLRGDGHDMTPDDMASVYATAISSASLNKTRNVLGAINMFDALERCVRGWGEVKLQRFVTKKWLTTADADRALVDSEIVGRQSWISTLSTYKFLIVPPGCGIQSQKQIEALLVLTVPVVDSNYALYSNLVHMGFPMLGVTHWDELSRAGGWLEKQWKALSPRLVSFRANCLTTEGYWTMITGTTMHCA